MMDLTAEFLPADCRYRVHSACAPQRHFTHRNERIDPSAIRRTALLTVEGERDDISAWDRRRPRTISAST